MSHRENRAFAARMKKFSKTIGHADLTAASNGLQQDILLGTLPPGAVILGRSVYLNTYFTGGSATAVTLAIGTGQAGDPDAIRDEMNIFDTTTNDIQLQGTDGVSPMGPREGDVYMQFDCDGSHTLLGLTAGEVTVELYYAVPDASIVD